MAAKEGSFTGMAGKEAAWGGKGSALGNQCPPEHPKPSCSYRPSRRGAFNKSINGRFKAVAAADLNRELHGSLSLPLVSADNHSSWA